MNAVRPFKEASVLAVVLGVGCLCNCRFSSVELTDAAAGGGAAILVDAGENSESFCVLKLVGELGCVSLLLCVAQELRH